MAVALAQAVVVELTDDYSSNTTMVATFGSAPTTGNVALAVSAIERGGRSVSGVTGCGTYAQVEGFNTAANPAAGLYAHAAEVTSGTTAQTSTLSNTTDFGGDIMAIFEVSGIDTANIESGTSVQTNVAVAGTTHNGGSITPSTENTLYVGMIAFSADPGTLGGDIASGWTMLTTNDPTRVIAYRIVNGSSSAVTFSNTSTSSRTSDTIFFALRGTADAGASIVPLLQHHYMQLKR